MYMIIDEKVKDNPQSFDDVLNGKKEDLEFAVKDFSQKLDIIIWGAVSEYAKKENVDVDIDDIKTYHNLNKIIETRLNKVIGDYLVKVGKTAA